MFREDEPMHVPVNINWWRWPVRVRDDRVECGECEEGLSTERYTALCELAEAIGDHAGKCVTS